MRTLEQGAGMQGLGDLSAGNLLRGTGVLEKRVGWHWMGHGQGFCPGACSVVAHMGEW